MQANGRAAASRVSCQVVRSMFSSKSSDSDNVDKYSIEVDHHDTHLGWKRWNERNSLWFIGHSPASEVCASTNTGGSSAFAEGTDMTAPAGIGPPSDVRGKSDARGEETMDMLRDVVTVSSARAGRPWMTARRSLSRPTSHLVDTFSPPSSCNCVLGSSSRRSFSTDRMPLLSTYTPPPTAHARQATCTTSASPPHFGKTAPKPGPNTPRLRRCRAILGRATAVDVLDPGF